MNASPPQPPPAPDRSSLRSFARLVRAMVRGGVGFAMVSMVAFFVWAVSGSWFERHFGEPGLYGACALVFLCASGPWLHRLLPGPGSLPRFYGVFIPAFLAYVLAWCLAWFSFHYGAGEWLGSLLGSFAFVGVAARRLHATQGFWKIGIVFFLLHSAGYFLGGESMYWIAKASRGGFFAGFSSPQLFFTAKLSWGLFYGLGFGAGLGYSFEKLSAKGRVPVSVAPGGPVVGL